jgi:DNA-binding response OmpR family regulator
MNEKGSILVVDDTPANLKLLADTLTAEGYQVLPADSGELALAAVAARPPELILLDIRMPGLDGFEVFRRLRGRAIPVIFISASTESAERVEGLKLGAVDFITKPFQREELLARVATHLELRRLRSGLEQQAVELRQANERLHREQEFARTLLDNITDGVVACDAKGTLVLFNRAAREWHGMDALALPPEEWAGITTFTDLMEPRHCPPSPFRWSARCAAKPSTGRR